MQTELLWAFVIIYAIDSLAPGPAVAMVMSRAASIGLARTLPFIAGLVIGDLLLFLMALSGLVALVKTLGPLFFIIKWLGVCYLLYLAVSMWTAQVDNTSENSQKNPKRDSKQIPKQDPGSKESWRSVVLAVFLPLGNPKAVGFYVALLPAFINVETVSLFTAVQFGIAIVVIWGLVLALYAVLADQGRRRLSFSAAQQWLNRGAAAAMVAAAGTIAFRQ